MLCRPMKKIRCRLSAELHEMLSRMSPLTMIICFAAALLPAFLLSALIAWKAVFFPAALPKVIWGLFLPLWILFSAVPPALTAAVLLSFPAGQIRCVMRILLPACTLLVLLSDLYVLLLLYHITYFLCVLCAAVMAAVSLLCVFHAWRLSMITGLLMLFSCFWNCMLFFISVGF
ncbi:MAG: hypothetical protein ACI3XM_11470 [Eubacteriales bacterium]